MFLEKIRIELMEHYLDIGLDPRMKKYVWHRVQEINRIYPGFTDEFLVKIKEKKNEVPNVQCPNGSGMDKEAE